MVDDIVKRLRAGEDEGVDGWWFVMAEAADEIERLREANEHGRGLYYKLDEERQKVIVQVARLRAVLKIFADEKTYITDSHIRAAKAALEGK